MLRLALLCLLLALSGCLAQPGSGPAAGRLRAQTEMRQANGFSLLQANIGNVDPLCSLQARSKLCRQAVEDRIAARIKALRPALVSLQEVLPDWICREGKVSGNGLVCRGYQSRPVRDQVRRLLGDDYSIVCEPHQSWDCVAVRKDIGRILPDGEGHVCPSGGLCGTERLSGGEPAALNRDQAYSLYRATTVDSPIDDGFHVMAVDIELAGRPLRLINGHPQSGGKANQIQARASQIEGLFSRLGLGPRTLIAGDLNLDPFRQQDAAVAAFNAHVDNYGPKGQLSASKAFRYHSGPVEQPPVWPPRLSAHYLKPLQSLTLDHVLSNFAGGSCRTLTGPEHLSGNQGTDHEALWCQLGG